MTVNYQYPAYVLEENDNDRLRLMHIVVNYVKESRVTFKDKNGVEIEIPKYEKPEDLYRFSLEDYEYTVWGKQRIE